MKFEFPVQYDKHSGPDAIGQHKFTFDVDESLIDLVGDIIKVKKGTQFIMTLTPADPEEAKKEVDEDLIQETDKETLIRFYKRFHSLISQLAEKQGKTNKDVKEEIKDKLIKNKVIKESTKELTIEQLADLINKLEISLQMKMSTFNKEIATYV